jgi:hypothetical protein
LATPHEMQRPKTCERFESARPLKTGSQPIGGRDSVVTTVDETVEVCLGATCKRSPLRLRSPVAAESPPTARPQTRPIMAILLAARRLTRSEIKSVLFVSICDTPQWGTRIVSTLSCTALRLLFRPLIIVNASQIAAGCGCGAATVLRPLLQHPRSLSVTAAARSFAPLWANGNGMKRLRLPRHAA